MTEAITDMDSGAANDLFAGIAAHRPQEQTGLTEPQPAPPPERRLPLHSPMPVEAKFQPRPQLEAEGVADELRTLRARMAPFLRNLAPKLSTTRISTGLKTFQWREETDGDRRCFADVLAGAGEWETVRIPHYGGPLGRAVTYYRTSFEKTPDMRALERLFICFKGVDYKTHVFVNGSFAGSHEGFFAPFEFDITAYSHDGENVLVVKVENDAILMNNDSWGDEKGLEGDKIYGATGPGYDDPTVGWHHCPPGMGIYQEVCIEARASLFIHDLFVRPLPEENRAEAWVEVWNCCIRSQPTRLPLSVFGQNFEATICEDREVKLPGPPGPHFNYYRFNIDMADYRAWELDTPWLYQLQVKLLNQDGDLLDATACQFGMRSFRMDTGIEPRGRMYFNGREIRLRGANTMGFEQQDVMNQDWDQLIDDILLAKLCNMNFWRLTQRPVQAEVYDYCDRLGLLTQTDLPLFSKMRRSQFAEGVRQAGEMERLIRSHPCNIMVTYINEPFPPAWGLQLWRHLEHRELESFFLACDQVVRLENPDRVIKPVDGDYDPPSPGLPDMHCYCGWYNGHGLDIGKLHRGYWQKVKPGWMYGCGEFGAEGLESADLMRRRYPPAWLPQCPEEEPTWTPDSIVKAQTGPFHYMWFDTQHSLEDWVDASQAHQAWVTRIMTEAFRRASRMNTFAIHLFIDAFPAGWMKTIMDVERRPKPAFFAYRDALTPLMVNLRTDRFAFFGGEIAELEAWICNDQHVIYEGSRLAYSLEVCGKILSGGSQDAAVPVCSSSCQGILKLPLPEVSTRDVATVRLALISVEGEVLHDTSLELQLFPRPETAPLRTSISILGPEDGKAALLLRDLALDVKTWEEGCRADSILVEDMELFARHQTALQTAVCEGATVTFLELPAGEHQIAGDTIECTDCTMGPVQFVSRATGHSMVAEFAPDDFKFWFDAAVGYVTPLLERTFSAEGWTSILVSGKGSGGLGNAIWKPTFAAAEKNEGRGLWRICNVKFSGRTATNPVAERFANKLFE